MHTEKRTRLSPAARRTQLIELGVEMLTSRRLEEISVEEIADRAGISRGLLFHYFTSKQDFHLAVVTKMAETLLERTAPDGALAPLDALYASLAAFIDFVSENRDGYVSLLRGAASGDASMRAVFDETRAEMANRTLAQTPVLGIPTGPRTRMAVRGWIAFTEEVVINWLADEQLPREELVNLVSGALPALLQDAAPE
ncbi:MAG: TetR/AcrR family transcriptional regulator [Mycobacteriaceae bacterium]